MTHKIFIDGGVGTTGLEIGERLAGRPELSFITLDEDKRKDAEARREAPKGPALVHPATAPVAEGRERTADLLVSLPVFGAELMEPGTLLLLKEVL